MKQDYDAEVRSEIRFRVIMLIALITFIVMGIIGICAWPPGTFAHWFAIGLVTICPFILGYTIGKMAGMTYIVNLFGLDVNDRIQELEEQWEEFDDDEI